MQIVSLNWLSRYAEFSRQYLEKKCLECWTNLTIGALKHIGLHAQKSLTEFKLDLVYIVFTLLRNGHLFIYFFAKIRVQSSKIIKKDHVHTQKNIFLVS